MAKVKMYKYKVVIRYIDNIDIFIIEDENILLHIKNSLRDNTGFIGIGNKIFNKKDIIYIEELKED